jgi:hypothetical protein
MLEGAFNVKVADVFVPDVETLPVPAHPVHTYRIPTDPDTGEETDAVTDPAASNHPLVGVSEP